MPNELSAQERPDREWHDIVERYQPLVFQTVVLILRDEDKARDVTQEVFIRVQKQAVRFLDLHISKRGKFLRTTAMRLALNSLRHRTQMRRDDRRNQSLDVGFQLIAGGPGLSTASDLLQKRHDVQAALGHLRPKDRVILRLYYFESEPLTLAEIAEVLGKSAGSVSKAFERILARLRDDPDLRKWMNQPS